MRRDPGSNYTMTEVYAAASVGASTVYSDSVNHRDGSAVSFLISCGTWATSFVATVQHSSDDGVVDTYADEADATMGNDVSLTLTEAGSGVLNVPNPREQYSRVKFVLGGTCVFACFAVLGPKKQVIPTDA